MLKFDDYTLLIRQSGSCFYEHYATVEALRAALTRWFTPKEIKSGVIEKLTTFSMAHEKGGYIENNLRNFTVCAYLAD